VLGVAHALVTPRAPGDGKGLSPAEPGLAEAMAKTGLVLTRRTDMWRAWVGFNLSHSLGLVLAGVAVLLAGRSPDVFDHEGHLFLPLAVLVSATYVRLAMRYWFRTPLIGTLVAFALFAAAALLYLLSMPVVRAGGGPSVAAGPPGYGILAVSGRPDPGRRCMGAA